MISPEFRELEVFLAMAKCGSFSAAAQKLGVTQPAVSAQILKLEQVIGFPLFYRSPEGTVMTEHGKAMVPLVEEVLSEYTNLMRRAAYWKRSQTKEVKIWCDGTKLSQEARVQNGGGKLQEVWQDLPEDSDWRGALRNLDVDIVLTGSFLKAGDGKGIMTLPVRRQKGATIAWNPDYYTFDPATMGLPEAISSTCILPEVCQSLGFREFLARWCDSVYGMSLDNVIECRSEDDAVNACKLGLGVMIFPGDADERMKLTQAGLRVHHAFEFILPKAYTFGIRYRTDEQNPQILATVAKIAERFR